ncbi:MAG: protein-tyrosine phosphatase family protein [archaeon]|nr:protein-tyrosine phosphatase family protein [archaeon]
MNDPSEVEEPDLRPKTLKELKHHVQKLALMRWGNNQQFDGFDDEFNLIEKRSEGDQHFEDFTSAKLPENRPKNRYSNVLPLESTRVHLPPSLVAQLGLSSYINANYITGWYPTLLAASADHSPGVLFLEQPPTSGPSAATSPCSSSHPPVASPSLAASPPPLLAQSLGISGQVLPSSSLCFVPSSLRNPKAYIACQGCLEETVADFWAMVWDEKATLIVMLTKILEGDRQKCHQYWSPRRAKTFTDTAKKPVLSLTVLADSSRLNSELDASSLSALAKRPSLQKADDLVLRRFSLKHHPSGEERVINHFQYVEWPDHGTPRHTATFRYLLRLVDAAKPTGPIVVHCSAGIGRTGTFCTVHMNLAPLSSHLPPPAQPLFDILGTVLRLRKERSGMVQTKEQYMFCYLAVLEGALEWKRARSKGLPWPPPVDLDAHFNPSSGCRAALNPDASRSLARPHGDDDQANSLSKPLSSPKPIKASSSSKASSKRSRSKQPAFLNKS